VSTPAGGELVGSAEIRVDADTDPAIRALSQFSRDAQGRIRDVRGRFASESVLINRSLGDGIGGASQRAAIGLGGLRGAMVGLAGATSLLAGGAALAAGAIAAVPLAFIGLGAVALKENDQVKTAFADMKEEVSGIVREAAQPLVQPFVQAAGQITETFRGIAPQLGEIFANVAPLIRPLVEGFGRLIENVMPGLVSITAAARPVIDALSAGLGQLGAGVSGFLQALSQGAQGAAQGLSGLLSGVGQLLPALGQFVGALAQAGGPVLAALARTLAQLASSLLGALSPALAALGPPITRLITNLGAGLQTIITALGPVLAAAAGAVGVLVDALSPLLPIAGELIAALLPPLVPLLTAVGEVIRQAAPVVQQLAQALAAALAPILAQLPALVQPLATVLTTLARAVFPVLARLVVALTPALVQIGAAFGNLLVALAPLLEVFGQLISDVLVALLPLLTPIIGLIGRLASVFAVQLAGAINNVVVPAVRLITALLRGDASGAWNAFKRLVAGVVRQIITNINTMGSLVRSALGAVVTLMRQLPGRLFAALRVLGSGLAQIARSALARFRSAVVSGGQAAVAWARGLPGRIRAAVSSLGSLLSGVARLALSRFRAAVVSGAASAVGVARGIPGRIRGAVGSVGGLLYGAGQDIVRGMINGLSSMAGALAARARSMAASAVAAARSALGISSPSRVFAQIGRDTGRGFIKGLTGTQRQIDQTADRVARSITSAFRGTGSRLDNRLVASIQRTNRRLQRLSVERDRIAKQIADARKFSTDLAARARGSGSLGGIVQPDFFAPRFVEARMRSALASIKRFTANVEKLRKKGLSKSLLRQVLELGPTQGGGFAASLAAADKATIKRFNKLQSSIGKASTKLGRTGADLLFDSGKKASQGFLAGLKAQQRSIESLMLRIAKGMQKAIRRALGIRSPSRVMAEVGRMSGLGLAGGLVRTVPAVDRAVSRLAGTVATGVPNRLVAPRLGALDAVGALPAGRQAAGGGMPQAIHIHVHNEGVIGSRRELDNWLVGSIDRLRLQKRLRLAGG
jgi:phage-related protein